ncbi:MAG: histidine phosphatase family protein [Cytophagaceae bacterium]|nr:histidine phosphatase family protein [Cytophagaceae bacterium]
MKSKKIYLIRHGQTDFNLKGIVQGSGVDSDLNETGRQQAEAFYASYKAIPFKKIYTSALIRTYQSVSKFITDGIPHQTEKALNEISWGTWDGKLPTSEMNSVYWQIVNRWKEGDLEAKIEGGETPIEVRERLMPMVERLLSQEDSPILVCMHGRAMRILLAMLTGQSLEVMDSFPHENLCLYLLEVIDGQAVIVEQNNLEHLN